MQLGPNPFPGRPAQVLAGHYPVGRLLYPKRLRRVHVAPAGQALIEVRFADSGQLCQPLPLLEIEGAWDVLPSAHPPQCSDSLHVAQEGNSRFPANRYVKMLPAPISELLELGLMETAAERRRRKLTELCDKHGRAAIAAAAGMSSVYLEQIIKGVLLPAKADGTRTPRSLGDKAARGIEAAFQLGEGWFDQPDEGMPLSEQAISFAIAFEKMTPKERARLERLMYVAMEDSYLGGMSNFGDLDDDKKAGNE